MKLRSVPAFQRSSVTTVPTWAAIAVSVGTPLITFVGVLVAQYILRKSASELETRSKREETLRVLRWAAELAVSDDEGRSKLGVSQLNALEDSALLDEAQQLFVDAALLAVVDEPADEIEEAGEDALTIRRPGSGSPPVLSDEDEEGGDDG